MGHLIRPRKLAVKNLLWKFLILRQVLNDFEIGYAPSNRATCRNGDCNINETKIAKEEIRVAVKMIDEEKPHLGPIPRWHHLACFKKVRKEHNWKDEYSGKVSLLNTDIGIWKYGSHL